MNREPPLPELDALPERDERKQSPDSLRARPAAVKDRLPRWHAALLAHDRRGARWLHRVAEQAWLMQPLAIVSRIADGGVWYALIAMLPWFGGPAGGHCALSMAVVGAVNLLIYRALKPRIARPRPFTACDGIRACAPALDEYSFPSGHTLHAVAFSTLIAAAYPPFAACVWGFTILVALSRVVLGLHYPGDVLAGAAIGALVAQSWLALV